MCNASFADFIAFAGLVGFFLYWLNVDDQTRGVTLRSRCGYRSIEVPEDIMALNENLTKGTCVPRREGRIVSPASD